MFNDGFSASGRLASARSQNISLFFFKNLIPIGAPMRTLPRKSDQPIKSLPLLAVLSCLFEDQRISGLNAGRELLKLRGGDYTEERAYNTLSDMRGIMFYLAFRAIAEKMNMPSLAYCTADKAALLFGCGLEFKNVEFRGNQLYLTISLNDYLFPRLSGDEKIELVKRIEREV